MNRRMYLKLAWSGIRKNRQLYYPYLLTCVCMVMMFYIISGLTYSELLLNMEIGGRTTTMIMSLGRVVVGIFSTISLFYTQSFLIRRRNREFGLYNILGMAKKNITRILLWETVLTFAVSLAAGLALGMLLFKLAELLLLRITQSAVTYSLSISPNGILETVVLFTGIFLITLLISIGRVRLSDPLALLKSENVGEKPPKINWVLAILGVLLLGGAYWLAASIQDPTSAMMLFFVASVIVILATYFLFIAGSVALCKLLQKNKRYYYRANHFVSVSSMAYRMKRNGAGLASICILSTMVLVMLFSTGSLFIGAEDALRSEYPYDFNIRIILARPEQFTDDLAEDLQDIARTTAKGQVTDLVAYRMAVISGRLSETGDLEAHGDVYVGINDDGKYIQTAIVSLSDYNVLTGQELTLAEDEALIWSNRKSYPYEQFSVDGGLSLRVRDRLDSIPAALFPSTPLQAFVIVVRDWGRCITDWDEEAFYLTEYCQFNMDAEDAAHQKTLEALYSAVGNYCFDHFDLSEEGRYYGYGIDSAQDARRGFYEVFGSLFFLGILLSIVFILAAVLIIYYKQISEGYEDAARFDIMQKVGMTRREIRRAVNSQVLTVFFAPLLLAGLHLVFASPMIWRMMHLLRFYNLTLYIVSILVCCLIFALFYALIYHRTARAYYAIVSGADSDN